MPRDQRSRIARQKQLSLGAAMIPNKTYFRIGEVSHLTETKPYVLRYWETEFPMLNPVKSRSGYRLYRRKDVQTIFEIKKLLQVRGFTIEGARTELRRASSSERHGEGESDPLASSPSSTIDSQVLNSIKRELQAVLTILSGKC